MASCCFPQLEVHPWETCTRNNNMVEMNKEILQLLHTPLWVIVSNKAGVKQHGPFRHTDL